MHSALSRLLTLLALIFSNPAFAVSWKVYGACSEVPIHRGESKVPDIDQSVGEISEQIFKDHKIPYVGNASGFSSIANSPTDLENIEVISDREMRVYGWCYTVNGVIPEKMPDQIFLKTKNDSINWFYAYSTNLENQWTDYCTPAYWEKPKQFCK